MNLVGVYDIFNEKWPGQTAWIFSDPHFDDEELRAGINRPSDEELIRNINAKCGRKDLLICLGDVGNLEYVRQLRAGYKVLICGNHDAGASNYKRHKFDTSVNANEFTQKEAYEKLQREYPGYIITFLCSGKSGWIFNLDNKLFDEVYTGPLMIGEKLLLSHEPVPASWYMNLHGHDHVGQKRKGCINCCLDVRSYEPIHMNQLLKQGIYGGIESIHRQTIDTAAKRAKKRGGKIK